MKVGLGETSHTSYSLLPTSAVAGKEWLVFLTIGWQECNSVY